MPSEPGLDLSRRIDVLTPECALLHLELAGPGSRFAAALVDLLWQLAGLLLAAAALALTGRLAWLTGRGGTAAWTIAILLGWLILWAYPVWFESRDGRTPGKRALGLRVVRADGRPVDWPAVLLRNTVRGLDLAPLLAPYLLGGLVCLFDRHHRRLGDLAAGTLVVRERPTPWLDRLVAGEEPTRQVGPRFTAAQLDQVSGEQIDLIGGYLRRRSMLPVQARRELASRLADEPRRRLGPVRGEPAGPDADEAWLEALWNGWTTRRANL